MKKVFLVLQSMKYEPAQCLWILSAKLAETGRNLVECFACLNSIEWTANATGNEATGGGLLSSIVANFYTLPRVWRGFFLFGFFCVIAEMSSSFVCAVRCKNPPFLNVRPICFALINNSAGLFIHFMMVPLSSSHSRHSLQHARIWLDFTDLYAHSCNV